MENIRTIPRGNSDLNFERLVWTKMAATWQRAISRQFFCASSDISLVLVFRSDLNGQANLAIIPRNCSLNFALLPEDFAFAAIAGFIWQLELAPCLCCLLSLMERRIFWRFDWWRFRFISVLRLFSELFAVSWCFIRNVVKSENFLRR